jgi:SAM-dependent methyltransferase
VLTGGRAVSPVSAAPPPVATTVNENSAVYYAGRYWNDLPQVIAYMSEHFTGDPAKWWVDDFKERFAPEPLGHGLVLNCGNGWMERELVDKDIVRTVTAFDYSWDLLCSAIRARGARAIHYVRADANTVSFAPDRFDVVFNVAALHHVQYLDRLCRALCASLKPSGVMVSFDYIGPHRNQYTRRHWRRIVRINQRLPAAVRKQPLRRAHLPTMLHTDPTEAIHSELTLATLGRYFDIFERHDTGGGVAYELLTHNPSLDSLGPEAADPYIREVLAWDRHYTARGQVPQLFSYFLARPRKEVLQDTSRLRAFQDEEDRREARARARGGVYSFGNRLTMLRHRLELCRMRLGRRLWSRQ